MFFLPWTSSWQTTPFCTFHIKIARFPYDPKRWWFNDGNSVVSLASQLCWHVHGHTILGQSAISAKSHWLDSIGITFLAQTQLHRDPWLTFKFGASYDPTTSHTPIISVGPAASHRWSCWSHFRRDSAASGLIMSPSRKPPLSRAPASGYLVPPLWFIKLKTLSWLEYMNKTKPGRLC